MRARGVRPCVSPACSLPISTRAAPSTMPELLPAWWTWLIFSTSWYFSSATASKPPISPMPSNDGAEPAQALDRRALAHELVVVEDRQAVGVLDRDDRLAEVAVGDRLGGARLRLGGERVDVRRGCSPRSWRSGRRRCPAARSRCRTRSRGSMAQAPPSEPIGTRLIDSTPPARIRSSQPERTRLRGLVDGLEAGGAEAVELDAGDVYGRPAARAAVLAMSAPWSPTGETTPSTTSSMPVGSSDGLRFWHLLDQAGDQRDRLDLVERAGLLAATTRRADGVVDECFGHGVGPY